MECIKKDTSQGNATQLDVASATEILKEHLRAQQRMQETEEAYNTFLQNTKWPSIYAISETRVYANGSVKLVDTFFRLDKDSVITELAKRTYPKHTKAFTFEHGTLARIIEPTKEQLTEALFQNQ